MSDPPPISLSYGHIKEIKTSDSKSKSNCSWLSMEGCLQREGYILSMYAKNMFKIFLTHLAHILYPSYYVSHKNVFFPSAINDQVLDPQDMGRPVPPFSSLSSLPYIFPFLLSLEGKTWLFPAWIPNLFLFVSIFFPIALVLSNEVPETKLVKKELSLVSWGGEKLWIFTY